MTPKVEQIPYFLTLRTENKTKHRKMHKSQRGITSLPEELQETWRKTRSSFAPVLRCTFTCCQPGGCKKQLRKCSVPGR